MIGAVLLARRAPAPPEKAAVGFGFCVAGGGPEGGWNPPLVFALLRALPADDAKALGAALAEANRRWAVRAHPLMEDLEDGDPDEALMAWRRQAPPAATTALLAAQRRFCTEDGAWCVQVVARGEGCPAGTTPAAGPDAVRARSLAWPFGHAVWLRVPSPREAAVTAARLRRTALVLHVGDDDATRDSAVREDLLRHEVLRRRATGETSSPDAILASATAFPAALDDHDVLVLPLPGPPDDAALLAAARAASPRGTQLFAPHAGIAPLGERL